MLCGPSTQCPLVSLALLLTTGARAALPRKRRAGAGARMARSRLPVEVAVAPVPARRGAPEPRSLGSHPGSPAGSKATCWDATWKTGNCSGPRPAGAWSCKPPGGEDRVGEGSRAQGSKPAGVGGGRRVPGALCTPSPRLQLVPGRESLPADPSHWAWPGPAEVENPGGRWAPARAHSCRLFCGPGRGLIPGLHGLRVGPDTEWGPRIGRPPGQLGRLGFGMPRECLHIKLTGHHLNF